MSDDHVRLEEFFSELSDLPPAERATRIEQLRAESPDLAAELESLLAAHDEAGSFLERFDATRAADLLHGEATFTPPERAGPWRLVREIGRGGLGVVYLGERDTGDFEQRVAVKLIKRGMDSELILKRFHHERRILASLEHPNIARLIDGGMLDDSRPYFAMEYIDGVPITKWCDKQRATVGQRLRLFEQVCRAVQYAHARLIVHRDLKPANILVTADVMVKLLDFGIAKLLDEGGEGSTALTVAGMRAMTPEYAAPEQIRGEPVGTATDVYALGVVLYELLTGHHPFKGEADTRENLARAICDTAPTLPSAAVSGEHAVAEARGSRPKTLRRHLRGDLDNVVLTAMAKEPARRYGSAEALAEDVRRHLEGLPVKARRETLAYRAGRFVYRHSLGVAATAAVMLALAGGLAMALWQADRAGAAAEQARQQAARAQAVQDFLLDIFRANSSRQADPVKARETTARELLDLGAARIESAMENAPLAKQAVISLLGDLYYDLAVDDEAVRFRREAVELARSLHGPHSLELAEALVALANALHVSESVNERGRVLEEAAAILEHRSDARLLRARLSVKQAEHFSSTDVNKAIDYARQAIALFEQLPVSSELADALYVQGVAYDFNGDHRRSAVAFQRAVEISREVEGFPNPYLPRFYALLANAQYRMLDIAGARVSARLAMRTASEVQGPEHVDTLQTTMRLGRLLFDTGSTHEGLQLLAQAKALALETRGRDDPFHTPQTLLEHGWALIRAGDPEAGLEDVWAAIENRRKNRPDTWYLGQMLEVAAAGLMELERGDEAEALLDEAARIRTDAGQPKGNARWNQHLVLRARHAIALGDADQALAWASEYVAEPTLDGSPSLDQIEAAVLQAETLLAVQDYERAGEAAEAALDYIEQLELAEFLAMQQARALFVQGRVALSRDDIAAGCGILEQVAAIQTRLLLADSAMLARTHDALARCLTLSVLVSPGG